jgi:oligopeptide transport system substrate-binding protein
MQHFRPLLTLTALAALAATPYPAMAQPAQPGWISTSACAPAVALIPTNTSESCGSDVFAPILDGLVGVDTDGNIVNLIAKSFETTDARVWRITIADGWTFHDGTPVTAKTFVDSWNWAAYAPNGQSGSSNFSNFEGYDAVGVAAKGTLPAAETMSGLKALGDMVLEVTLQVPESSFRSKLSSRVFHPLPASFYADPEAYARHPIGTGPFMFESGSPDTGYRLKAYPAYGGPGKATIEGVELRIYRSTEAAYNDLVAGNLDLMRNIPKSKLVDGLWKRDLEGRTGAQAIARLDGLGMPWMAEANAALVKPQIRQAISMAIDRQAIVDIILSGAGQPATGWAPPGIEGYKAGACGEYCTYDPQKAKALFDAAGGYEGPIKIYYDGSGSDKPTMDAICNSIQNALGVTCVTSALADNAAFRTLTRSGKADGPYPANWTLAYPSIDNALVPIYSKDGSSNRGSYNNPEMDRLFELAAGQTGEQALETYREAERLLRDALPRIPLWNPQVTYGYSKRIADVKILPTGRPDYTTVTLAP